jgi:hypothetical protein
MDFIEQWFGVFPDGGNGSLEALCLFTAIAAIVMVVTRRRFQHRLPAWSRRSGPLR